MYCSYCGKKINENVKFCPHCNNKINTIQDEIAVKKKQSDSENQPTSAILGFVLAIFLCIYGVVCLKEEADKTWIKWDWISCIPD